MVDVREPSAARLLTVVPLGFRGVNVDALADHAAVVGVGPEPSAALVRIGDLSAPTPVKTFALPPESYPTGVALTDTRILVALHDSEVLFLER